ncbi:hypothetical protein [Actinomadura kijaniata]|uniref:hypothetical protein n=1 Tax=Actinomadura kijaniata TaxID=46161 RepID=UPI00082C3DAE|nr:hypothetical protein [Actinomadura kijaniata]
MDEKQERSGYAAGQLAKAFVTAVTHQDADVRRLAERRMRRWRQVMDGITDGTISVGERAPVAGLPVWATPEVVRGGFATGNAAAGGPLTPHERTVAERAGIPAERRAVFEHHLSDAGIAGLAELLDSGRYEVEVPEEAALPVVAWLLRAGDVAAALRLVEEIEPHADRLRFAPRPGDAPVPDPSVVSRETVGDVRAAMAARGPNPRIEAMNEALSVWNPFADELLEFWLADDGSPEWRERGRALLARYRGLAAVHTLCTKHRRPKENVGILRAALEDLVEGREPDRGRVRYAARSMVAKRGEPGSRSHTELRRAQAAVAERPTHHALAQIVLSRLSALPQTVGVDDVGPLVRPVTGDEEALTGIPAGSELPEALRHAVERALRAPIGALIERGVVPSAEVLAELVPQIVASTAAESYADEALRLLMAAHYRAFRNRRSLLLLDLDHQVRVEELPWVRAVDGHRRVVDGTARTALREIGELALQGFPGTILPNPLLREMDTLARGAGLDVVFVEELAADIFMGAFSGKFLRAAKLAGKLLDGSLYARYYDIDYQAVQAIEDVSRKRRFRASDSQGFAELCTRRAGEGARGYSVAANGMVIEQAQILTTHNLAALAGPVGVRPAPGWEDLARRAFGTVCRLLERVHGNPRPLGTVKDAAYAWRQTVFFLTMAGTSDFAWLREEAGRHPAHVRERLGPVLGGLREAATGERVPGARRFTGWAAGGHWMLDRTRRRT